MPTRYNPVRPCDTWKSNLPNVQEVLETADYRDSRYLLTRRKPPIILDVSEEYCSVAVFRVS